MAHTQNELDYVVNPGLDRIGAENVALASQTGVRVATLTNRHYSQTRDTLLRSFEWTFAQVRTTLYPIQTLTIDYSPGDAIWTVGDTITGVLSGKTGTVLAVNSDVSYEVTGSSGSWTDGETITDATVYDVRYNGASTTYLNATSGASDTVTWYDDGDQVVCGTGYPSASNTSPGYEWDYQYDLPSDFIRLVRVYEDDGTDGASYRYHIEGNRILTNYDTMNIQYIFQETDPTAFTDLFREVLVLRLAMKLINPLASTASDAFKQELRNDLKYQEMHARVIDAQENNTTGRFDYTLARYSQEQG